MRQKTPRSMERDTKPPEAKVPNEAIDLNAEVGTTLASVISYGEQLSSVFHTHILTAETPPKIAVGITHVLDSTLTALKAVQKQCDSLNESGTEEKRLALFSEAGKDYVRVLARECGLALGKIVPVIEKNSVDRKRKSKGRRTRHGKEAEEGAPEPSPETALEFIKIKLNEESFLRDLDSAHYRRFKSDSGAQMLKVLARLHELQPLLLLISQVIMLGALSRDT